MPNSREPAVILFTLRPANDHTPSIRNPFCLVVTLHQAKLLNKLFDANVVERRNGLTLTQEFRSYLESCNQRQYIKLDRVRGWRLILAYYDPSLGFLSDREMDGVVCMIEYSGHDQNMRVIS